MSQADRGPRDNPRVAYDQTVIDDFNRALRDRGVTSTKIRKSLFEAGIVESGLQNLDHGDRDSLGALQQRPSQGWKHATDPYHGALDFLDQAIPLAGKYKTSGELAQGVQRSAFPGRYNDVSSQAASLLGGLTGGGGQAQPSASSSAGSSHDPRLLDAGQGSDFTSLLGSLLAKPQPAQPSTTPIQTPSFAAGPKLPQGAQLLQPTPTPAPQQQDKFSDALGLIGALGGSGPTLGPDQASEAPQAGSAQPTGPLSLEAGTGTGADAALSWAKSKIGFKETGTNAGGLASYANSRFGMSGQPWCAMFTSLAVTKGGAPKSARTASVAAVRSKAQQRNGYEGFVDPGSAQAGDLILFGNQHIGMVERVSGGKVFYVGGNQSNGVTEASVPVGHGDIVRPKYGAR